MISSKSPKVKEKERMKMMEAALRESKERESNIYMRQKALEIQRKKTSSETNKKREIAFMTNDERRIQKEKKLLLLNEKKKLRYEDILANHARLKKAQEYNVERYMEKLRKKNEHVLTIEAQKVLQVDANLRSGLQTNIEEEKMIQNINKLSQKLFSSFQSQGPKKVETPKEEIKNEDV